MATVSLQYIFQTNIYALDGKDSNDLSEYRWYNSLDYAEESMEEDNIDYKKIKLLNDRDYFLFYFYPILPSTRDTRYETIKRYTSKDYNYGLEYKVAIQFEIQARRKENVYAIEDAVTYYKDYFLKDGAFIYESFHNFDNSKINANTSITPPPPVESYVHNTTENKAYEPQNIAISNSKPYENYLKYIEHLTNLVKKLLLIPYQIYTEHNRFEHWSVNPFIYDIVNFVYYYDNTVTQSQYKMISHDEKKKISTFQITSEFVNTHQYHQTMLMKNNMRLEQNIALNYESALGEKDLTELEVDILKLNVNRNIISNNVRYSYYYPKIKEYSTLNIEVDLSTNSKHIKAYLNAIIDTLDEVVESDTLPPLFDMSIEDNSRLSVADAFFTYDYYTYRVEQISHREKYALSSCHDEDFNHEHQEYNQINEATSIKIYQEILDVRDSKKTTKSIEQEINKIKELIKSAKNNQKII